MVILTINLSPSNYNLCFYPIKIFEPYQAKKSINHHLN